MIQTITMAELHERFLKLGKNEIILDVRTPEEFKEGHIPGALNIPHDEVMKHASELRKYDRVYVHCRSGSRVQLACYDLAGAGLTNLVPIIEGGMPEWEAGGFPVER